MKLKKLLEKLKAIGLTNYEAGCYVALLNRSEMAAVDVAKASGVPRTRVYEVLENLMRKGLCNTVPGPVIVYKAAEPSMLKIESNDKTEKILKKINEHEQEIANFKNEIIKLEIARDEAITVLTDIFKKGKNNNESVTYKYLEIIRNQPLLDEIVKGYIANTKREMLGFVIVGPHYDLNYGDTQQEVIKKGVICKSVYEIPEDPDKIEFFIRNMESGIKIGEKVKIAEYLPIDLTVFDNETVIYSVKDPLPYLESYTCIIAQNRYLADFFAMSFNLIWDNSYDPDELPMLLEKRRKQQPKGKSTNKGKS